ncbi:MAG: hypothetical protein ABW252_24335 [Polyangiales bacterium]
MHRSGTKILLTLLLLALPAGSVFAYAVANDAVLAGWSPLVRLFGHGDAGQSVREMRRLTKAFEVALHHKSVDKPTQEFIDDTMDDLESFDLGGFHDRLPEKRGESRELWVRGDLKGERYFVRRADDRKFQVSLKGARTELAAMSTLLRSTPSTGHGGRSSFLVGARFGLGIGAFEWDSATQAIGEFVRLLSVEDVDGRRVEAQSEGALARTRALHPKLSPEDYEVLSLLFGAYPQLSETLSRLGRVDNVRTTWPSKSYQQVVVQLTGDTDRFGKHYPALAKHLAKLDQIAKLDIRWQDGEGRSLLNAKVDSDKLTITVECYVKQGKLLPFKGVKVYDDTPLDYLSEAFDGTKILVDARLKLLGVVIKLDDLKLDNWYQPHGTYAEFGTSMRTVPGIHVEGAALGFVPTALVDAFIPGNIESVTRNFLEVAAKGNKEKGVVAGFALGAAERGGNGVLEAGIDVEALDNFMVKLAVGMVNDRLIPNDSAVKDATQFATDLHDSFVKDLGRFAKTATTASAAAE